MECERMRRDDPGPSSASEATEAAQTEVDWEAEVHWQKHLAAHKSVIVDTFQGQFKSTVSHIMLIVANQCSFCFILYAQIRHNRNSW